jgi:ribonuclease VapC
MIAIDTSALMAIILNEPQADRCEAAITSAETLIMSAGTLAEVLIVAARRDVSAKMKIAIDGLPLDIIPLTPAAARRAAAAYDLWGKGIHPASLNYGDCFAYEVAKANSCPLLFVGNDFSKTDVASAL